MSKPTVISTLSKTAPSTKKKGNNRQPPGQIYKARPSKTIKCWTETLKSVKGVTKLSPEQKSALAFFTFSSDRSAD